MNGLAPLPLLVWRMDTQLVLLVLLDGLTLTELLSPVHQHGALRLPEHVPESRGFSSSAVATLNLMDTRTASPHCYQVASLGRALGTILDRHQPRPVASSTSGTLLSSGSLTGAGGKEPLPVPIDRMLARWLHGPWAGLSPH